MIEQIHSLAVACEFSSRMVTTSPRVSDWLRQRGGSPLCLPVDNPAQGLELSPKDVRRFDRQTLLLMQVLRLLEVAARPEAQREILPVQLAVGPAQTDLQALLRWSARVAEDEPLPMVQPAQAIGLLPNSPLSHLSIAFGLRGEPMVWTGLQEAGCRALASSLSLMADEKIDGVLCLSVSSPDNYFVRQVFERNYVLPSDQTSEMAVAIRFSRSPAARTHRQFHVTTKTSSPDIKTETTRISRPNGDSQAGELVPDGLPTTPLLALASLEQRPDFALIKTQTAAGCLWEFEVGDLS